MGKKRTGVKPDTALKAYWRRNEEFADMVNACLYGGRRVIRAQDLQELDTESSVVLEIDGGSEGVEASRDVFKVAMRAEGVCFAVIGLENQEGIHYAMALRDMEYAVYAYHKQYEKIKEKYPNRKDLIGNEFLSYMKKTDKLTPVVTIVVYYGDEPWDGARSLYEMMDIPEELKPYTNDYRMNLVEIRNADLPFHNKNNQDLFRLLQILYRGERRSRERDAIAYAKEHKIDRSVILAIGSTSGLDLREAEQKGELDMCELFREIEARGRNEGIAQEIVEMGLDFKLSDEDILSRLQKKLDVTLPQARDYLAAYSVQKI